MTQGEVSSRRWNVLAITTGVAGIGSLTLVMTGQSLMQVGGMEPAFNAPAAEIVEFFESRDTTLFTIGSNVAGVGLVLFLWFLGGLWAILRRAEGDPGWRSVIALVSGLAFLASLNNGWQFAMIRIDEGLDPQLARFAFDMGNFGLAESWVSIASLLLASGWIILDTRVVPRWIGWSAIVIAIGLVIGRAFWISPVFFAPYLLFWVWVVAICVTVIRNRAGAPQLDPVPAVMPSKL